jgi:putative tricarboxylic transport membrane protein
MIPLVTLGIPGSAPAAVVAGALMLRGLNPGPDLFQSNGTLVYSFGWSLLLAGVWTFVLGSLLSPWLARMVSIPLRLLAPLIMFLSVIGAYAIRNDIFDVYMMLGLGLFTFIVGKFDFHPGPIGLGLIMGPIVEPALVQSMYLADATSYGKVFFGSTTDVVLIVLTVLSVAWVVWSQIKDKKQGTAAESSPSAAIDLKEGVGAKSI